MSRKVFQFAIEIDGVDVALIQEVKVPEIEIGAVIHGGQNGTDVKTAGGTAVSDAELMKTRAAVGADRFAYDWLVQAQNGLASDYKKDVVFKELDEAGNTLDAWLWEGAWCRKASPSNYKRGNQNENVIETITISVDRVRPL